MKKLLLITMMWPLWSGAAFGQGYFVFSGSPAFVWDNWSTGAPRLAATNRMAFLWGPASATPLISSVAPTVATNAALLNPSWASDGTAQEWNLILNDPNFQLAYRADNPTQLATVLCGANGAWNYGASFGVAGTAPGAYRVFVIGWDANYATPQAAAAAAGVGTLPGAAIGWSQFFTYNATAAIGTPATFAASGMNRFGVYTLIPEPSSFALAGLGAVVFALSRRNRSKLQR